MRSLEIVSRLKMAECQERVCRLLLAVGPDLLALGRRCAADPVCTESEVQAVFPKVWTDSSVDSSRHR